MPPNQYCKTVQTRAIATAVISAFGVTGKSKERDAGEWCDGVIQGEHVTLKCMTPTPQPGFPHTSTPPHVLLHHPTIANYPQCQEVCGAKLTHL